MEKKLEHDMEAGSFYLGCRGYNSKAVVGCAEVAVTACQSCGCFIMLVGWPTVQTSMNLGSSRF